jgi:hypothetical protein
VNGAKNSLRLSLNHRPHGPAEAADPGASRFTGTEHRPSAVIAVPPGFLAVQVMNAIATSAADGGHEPGDIAVLPDDEARALLRQGLAREVLAG